MLHGKIIRIITAMDVNGLIGKGNALPWPQIPEDMKWFRRQTMNHTVVYGRKTWDSIPEQFRPLPGRQNIILSRQKDFYIESAQVAQSFDEAVALSPRDIICIIGGAEIYKIALTYADELIISHIGFPFEGDVYFPTYDKTRWRPDPQAPNLALHMCPTEQGYVVPVCFTTYKQIAAP